jgi:hypothetical protein
MTFNEALAQQPTWVGIWLNVLLIGAFILPFSLLIWRETRITAAIALVLSGLAAGAIVWLYGQMGYVKLLGLPHIVFWTPLVVLLIKKARQSNVPVWPSRILLAVAATMLISLVFDYVDVVRYLLGDRIPTILPPGLL